MWKLVLMAVPMLVALGYVRPVFASERLTLRTDGGALDLDVLRVEGTAYVPIDPLVTHYGAKVEWIGEDTLSICVVEDLCAYVKLDGSDDRIIETERGRFVRVTAIPELFRVHFDWDAERETLRLVPGFEESPSGLRLGDAFPDIALPDMAGNLVSFGRFRGRKVVLFTWASW